MKLLTSSVILETLTETLLLIPPDYSPDFDRFYSVIISHWMLGKSAKTYLSQVAFATNCRIQSRSRNNFDRNRLRFECRYKLFYERFRKHFFRISTITVFGEGKKPTLNFSTKRRLKFKLISALIESMGLLFQS
jgi:hypothetical protein